MVNIVLLHWVDMGSLQMVMVAEAEEAEVTMAAAVGVHKEM